MLLCTSLCWFFFRYTCGLPQTVSVCCFYNIHPLAVPAVCFPFRPAAAREVCCFPFRLKRAFPHYYCYKRMLDGPRCLRRWKMSSSRYLRHSAPLPGLYSALFLHSPLFLRSLYRQSCLPLSFADVPPHGLPLYCFPALKTGSC